MGTISFPLFADFSLLNFDIRDIPYYLYLIITKLVILKRSNPHVHDLLNIDFHKFEQKLMVLYMPRRFCMPRPRAWH